MNLVTCYGRTRSSSPLSHHLALLCSVSFKSVIPRQPLRNFRRTSVSSRSANSSPNANATSTAVASMAIGSVAGMLGSLAGMGGGFVMIPLMTLQSRWFGLPALRLTQHEAHGTSLFAVAATGLAGAMSYGIQAPQWTEKGSTSTSTSSSTNSAPTGIGAASDAPSPSHVDSRTGTVRLPEAVAIAATAMVTAQWGARATLLMSGRLLKQALGGLMIVVAPMVPAKTHLLAYLDDRSSHSHHGEEMAYPTADESNRATTDKHDSVGGAMEPLSYDYHRLLAPACIGIGSGFLSGLFGVGGGTIVVPALTLCCADMTHHEALATSLAAMIVPAISGTVTHYRAGHVALRVAPYLAIGALLGASIGAQVSLATNEDALRWGFGALLLSLGLRTLIKA